MASWQWFMEFDLTERLLYGAALLGTLGVIAARSMKLEKKHWFRDNSETLFVAVWAALFIRVAFVEAYSIPSESMVPTLEVGDHLLVGKMTYGYHLPFTKGRVAKLRSPRRGEIVIFVPPHKPKLAYVKRCVGLPGDILEVRDKAVYINGKLNDVEQAWVSLKDLPAAVKPELTLAAQELMAKQRVATAKGKSTHMLWSPILKIAGHSYLLAAGDMNAMVFGRLLDLPAAGKPASIPKGQSQPEIWNGLGNRDWFGPYTLKPGEFWMMGDDRDNSADSRYFGPVPEDNLRGTPLTRYWPLSKMGSVH